MSTTTLSISTAKFIRSSKAWLTTDDEPALQALRMLAATADAEMNEAGKVSGATMGQYGLTYRNLLTRKPKADGSVNADDSDLS